jgi:hypothetical protein
VSTLSLAILVDDILCYMVCNNNARLPRIAARLSLRAGSQARDMG